MKTDQPKTIYLKDYKAPSYQVEHLDLLVDIFDGKTIVTAVTQYAANTKTNHDGQDDLYLNGEDLTLISCVFNDQDILDKVEKQGKDIVIKKPGTQFTTKIVTEIYPEKNTYLEGLYKSGDSYCTQCEAEGFRRITFYQDRPDVMAPMTVRVQADKKTCPVLLSNGNQIDKGDMEDGRHYIVYDDPFPKSCYLFALVAGKLVFKEDRFKTMSGRQVDLKIYVRQGDEEQIDHAMESLKKSMEWDEQNYGREYNYDRFDIVAVSDFNMGAMENTSLNIFNTSLVLAHPETATDMDFINVESVIGHEYFHNWTGNRVTCRDWFQLSLKEGLTVFRDQCFSADMNSQGVMRITDVALLRRAQFTEDAGQMAHPVRPDNYIEINNFYTVTVYEKGAEVIRMLYKILGAKTFRKATDLYFERHDGQAVRCEDFVKCMEDASGRDLSQFWLWYEQAGTPVITFEGAYNEYDRSYNVKLTQSIPDTPGQKNKKPMHIPVKVGLVGPDGKDMDVRVLDLTQKSQSFTFENIAHKPVPSILREFSAPVILKSNLQNADYRFLMVHDNDGFNQWESSQNIAMNAIHKILDGKGDPDKDVVDAYGDILSFAAQGEGDKALLAKILSLPGIAEIGQQRAQIDPSAIHQARSRLLSMIANTHVHNLEKIYELNQSHGVFSKTADAMGQRALKNTALELLSFHEDQSAVKIARLQYNMADNMTDRVAALSVLTHFNRPERDQVFDDFLTRFKDKDLVINKWFSLQMMGVNDKTNDLARQLRKHDLFQIQNPNRVRALYGAFAMNNPVCFHDAQGRGYDFLKDVILELNIINPQIAARLLTPFQQWRRYTADRQDLMHKALNDIASHKELSANVYEIVTKSLKDAA